MAARLSFAAWRVGELGCLSFFGSDMVIRDTAMYHQFSGANTYRGGGSRSSRRGKRSTSSGQTVVYPFCSSEHEAIRCVLFIHANASKILSNVAGPLAPVVSVSSANTLGDILAGNGRDVFEPDAMCMHLPNAKAHLPGFYIDLYSGHSFTPTSRRCTIHRTNGVLQGSASLTRW